MEDPKQEAYEKGWTAGYNACLEHVKSEIKKIKKVK